MLLRWTKIESCHLVGRRCTMGDHNHDDDHSARCSRQQFDEWKARGAREINWKFNYNPVSWTQKWYYRFVRWLQSRQTGWCNKWSYRHKAKVNTFRIFLTFSTLFLEMIRLICLEMSGHARCSSSPSANKTTTTTSEWMNECKRSREMSSSWCRHNEAVIEWMSEWTREQCPLRSIETKWQPFGINKNDARTNGLRRTPITSRGSLSAKNMHGLAKNAHSFTIPPAYF